MNREQRLHLSPPHMDGRELQYIKEAFASNYIAPAGNFLPRFEEAVLEFTGARAALALSSGTAAIHLALRLAGIGKGDRVLASTFTFIGSVAPILYQEAEPIFIDSDTSWNLDPDLLEIALERERPKALILTHLYGQAARVDRIAELCEAYGTILIEDAAESLGATLGGRHTGTFGTFGIYSFNGNKIITTSGGGVLVSNDTDVIIRARKLATQAKEPELWYEHREWGYNYRLSNILAAIGVGQMEVLSERIEKKRNIFSWYRQALADRPEIVWMPELPNSRGNRWLSTCTIAGADPSRLVRIFESHNIETRPLWKPMHRQPVFSGTKIYGGSRSEEIFTRGICLPSGTQMERSDVERVAEILREALR